MQNGQEDYDSGQESGLPVGRRRRVGRYPFRIDALVQCGKLDKGALGKGSLPLVEFHDDSMDGEEQIVIRLLQGLCDGIELALVATAVVRLRLAGDRADEVAVHTHCETEHIDCLLDVGSPVTALLVRLNSVDDHLVLFLPRGRNIKRAEEGLATVLGAREKVDDVALFLPDPLLHLLLARDAFPFEDVLPIALRDLDVVLDGSGVFEFRFLCHADELLDVIPLAAEQRGVIWYRIIRRVRRRHTADDGKFSRLAPLQARFEIVPGAHLAKERDDFNLVDGADRLLPVGIKHMLDDAILVGLRESAVDYLLAVKTDDAFALLVEDDDRDAPSEVLEILAYAEEIRSEVVAEKEVIDRRADVCGTGIDVVLQPVAVAYLRIEHLTGREGLVPLDHLEDMVRHLIVRSPRHILNAVGEQDGSNLRIITKDVARVHRECSRRIDGDVLNAAETLCGAIHVVFVLVRIKRFPHNLLIFCRQSYAEKSKEEKTVNSSGQGTAKTRSI